MHCEKAEMLLAQAVFEEIAGASQEGAELYAHLAGCQNCARLLADMRVSVSLAREGLQASPAPVLGAERRAALLQKAAEMRARRSAAGRRAGVRLRRNHIIGGSIAAAAAMLVMGAMMPMDEMGFKLRRPEPLCPPDSVVIFTDSAATRPESGDESREETSAALPQYRPDRGLTADAPPPPSGAADEEPDNFHAWQEANRRDEFKSPPPRLETPTKPSEKPPKTETRVYDVRDLTGAISGFHGPEMGLETPTKPSDKPPETIHSQEAWLSVPTGIGRQVLGDTVPGGRQRFSELEKRAEEGRGTVGKLVEKNRLATEDSQFTDWDGYRKVDMNGDGVPDNERGMAYAREKFNKPSPVVPTQPQPAPGPAAPPDGKRFWKQPPEKSPGPASDPSARPVERPVIVHEKAAVADDGKVRDNFEIDNDMDSQPKTKVLRQEDPISDIPLGGTDRPGAVGVGGGQMAGIYGNRESGGKNALPGKAPVGDKKDLQAGEDTKTTAVDVVKTRTDAASIRQVKSPINEEIAKLQGAFDAMDTATGFTAPDRPTSPRERAAREMLNGGRGGEVKEKEDGKSVTILTDGTASMSAPPPKELRTELAETRRVVVALKERKESDPAPFIVLTPEQAGAQQQQQGQQQGQSKLPPQDETPVEKPAAPPAPESAAELPSGAVFKVVPVNPFVMAAQDRLSTFALDVDTASYSIARRYIRGGYLPPVGSVRMEEYVNAFDYNYPRRTEGTFAVISEAAPAPFGQGLVLLKVGVRGKLVGREGRKPAHLVFVVDASGSMDQPDRMPLVKYALGELAGQLGPDDRVSLVAYGTKPRLVLDGAGGADREAIAAALGGIQCEGSTNLLDGLELGYRLAARSFVPGGINRVILCSDGAANIGITGSADILDRVRGFRDQGITCTSVGFGAGTYNDELLEKLADSGDGSYVFVDSKREARRVFVEEMSATLQTIAKDAKIQVEFDPQRVRRYRLIGYENRDIADEKFRDDTVDAGEVGSGQSATALYELELQGAPETDLGTVYVRYRDLDTGAVEEISHRLESASVRARTPESDPRFFLAACAAEFAELLRGSEHAAGDSFDALRSVLEQTAAQPALRGNARVQELLDLVRRAKGLPRAE